MNNSIITKQILHKPLIFNYIILVTNELYKVSLYVHCFALPLEILKTTSTSKKIKYSSINDNNLRHFYIIN